MRTVLLRVAGLQVVNAAGLWSHKNGMEDADLEMRSRTIMLSKHCRRRVLVDGDQLICNAGEDMLVQMTGRNTV